MSEKVINDNLSEIIYRLSDKFSQHGIESLTRNEKVFFLISYVDNDVNMDGFYKYFYGVGGDFIEDTISSFKSIGANKIVGIIQKAYEIFPKKPYPKDNEERIDAMYESNETLDLWLELDEEYRSSEEDLGKLLYDFANNNNL